MNLSILDDVVIDPKVKGSVNYAKARYAIEASAKNRAEKRQAKQVVINFLNGTIEHTEHKKGAIAKHNMVKFPDNSTAQY